MALGAGRAIPLVMSGYARSGATAGDRPVTTLSPETILTVLANE